MSVQGRMFAFTLLAHRDGASSRRNASVHWEVERVIELLRLENYSGRLGVCWHMKIIILLRADGELTRDCAMLSTACSSPGQEAKTFIFLGGRGC